FFGLITNRVIQVKEISNADLVIYEAPTLAEANFEHKKEEAVSTTLTTNTKVSAELAEVPFVHLHNHSEFSTLQSTTKVNELIKKAKEFGMEAVALTDHGNMMATFHFVRDAFKQGIKPIVGCEF